VIERIKTFYHETILEVKNCTWPNKDELIEKTILVLIATVLLTLFTMGVDQICQTGIEWMIFDNTPKNG
jgi:preprotein translocase subunit SecE